ncbi:J domain-containing protein [Clostridium estertheticum]|uniref:J domain-containing protein n=1 Tax=Clostridium estertheticum TaxID=238834 RepID=UPI001C0A9B32|nr:J domain-containing protein [Clostridium estertheticum]MBU3175838.1 J domain-containing protein [Clostridium estertheticum]
MKNFYEILQVSPKATKDEIRKRYRILVKKYHPDTNINDKTLGAKFQEINEAYSILSDERLKKQYDEKLYNIKQNTGKQNNNTSSKSRKKDNINVDNNMGNMHNKFEDFFGFSANTDNVKKDSLHEKEKNPIDTSQLFNNFFKNK